MLKYVKFHVRFPKCDADPARELNTLPAPPNWLGLSIPLDAPHCRCNHCDELINFRRLNPSRLFVVKSVCRFIGTHKTCRGGGGGSPAAVLFRRTGRCCLELRALLLTLWLSAAAEVGAVFWVLYRHLPFRAPRFGRARARRATGSVICML